MLGKERYDKVSSFILVFYRETRRLLQRNEVFMSSYYLNKKTDTNPGNNNEIHVEGCKRMPSIENRVYLGVFNNGVEAKNYAKSIGYSKADGCYLCSPEAHEE